MRDDLYKRGKIWWTWVANERGVKVRKSTHRTDKTAARLEKRRLERKYADPSHAAANKTTLAMSVDAYITTLEKRKRAKGTISKARTKTGHLLRVFGVDHPTNQITAPLVDAYIVKRDDEGAKATTISAELSALRQTLKIAKRAGCFLADVEAVMPVMFSDEYEPVKRFLVPDELELLAAELGPRRGAIVKWLVATSGRISDAFRAHRSDIDFARGIVHVRGTKTKKSKREVPITSQNKALLEDVLRDAAGPDVLFSPWGKYHRDIWAACKRAGIAKCSPNDLRRTHGKWLRFAGVSPDLIGEVLGHVDSTMAEKVYAGIDGTPLARLVNEKLAVSNLYGDDCETGGAAAPPATRSTGKNRAPGTIRTCDLSFRKAPSMTFFRLENGRFRVIDASRVPNLYRKNFGEILSESLAMGSPSRSLGAR